MINQSLSQALNKVSIVSFLYLCLVCKSHALFSSLRCVSNLSKIAFLSSASTFAAVASAVQSSI